MGIPPLTLAQHDLTILVISIDAYMQSLHLPHLYPEHSTQYISILQTLRSILWILTTAGRDIDLLMTEPEVIALDEAVQGFIRICERSKKDERGYPRTVAVLNQFHQWLEQMKLLSIGQ